MEDISTLASSTIVPHEPSGPENAESVLNGTTATTKQRQDEAARDDHPDAGEEEENGSALTLTEPLVAKRKRGRPRKYSDDGEKVLPAASSPSPPRALSARPADGKRGRGRPKGTGRLQLLASLGRLAVDTAGGSFTPHVMTVPTGADVVNRIIAFAQKGPRAVCVLSAVGGVSIVTIRQPSGLLSTYEGHFDILTLSGTYVFTPMAGSSSKRKSGMLSVSLARPNGSVFGGCVGGHLIASHPILLIVGSFKQDIGSLLRRKLSLEASPVAAARFPAPKEVDGSCVAPPTSSAAAISSGEDGGGTTKDDAIAAIPIMIHPPSTLPNVGQDALRINMPAMSLDQSPFSRFE